MNLYQRMEEVFHDAAGASALCCPEGEGWSYGRLLQATERVAGALASLGVGVGDRVLVQTAKTPQAVALYLACLKVGAVYAPINTAYTAAEVAYFLADLQPALFVSGAPMGSFMRGASPSRTPAEGSTGDRVRVETLDAAGGGSLAALAARARPFARTVDRAEDDIASIIYTSGTTGRSKGAMLTHGNLASNARALLASWGWRADDVLLHALPMFHVHGLFVALHCALLTATPTIFLPKFEVSLVLRLLPRATVMMGVPTFYTRLLGAETFGAALCRNMRLFVSGSAPLAARTFATFEQRTGFRILERYGMSETLMNTTNPLAGERVAGTVGFALPEVEVRVANEAGEPLPSGVVGGIEVRGPNVFRGYWRMLEKTREEFRADGFFVTGDLGALSDDGRLTIVGREKDVIISGGYNVYPKEVETILEEMPEVAECAVVGVPHADFGEAVVAVVVAEEELQQARLDEHLRDRLARYKQPKRVLRVAQLPRNAMGKVRKNALRDAYRGLFHARGRLVAEPSPLAHPG